jgi:hypothetical protein
MHQFLRGKRRIQTGPSLNGFLPPPARGTSEGLCDIRLRPVCGIMPVIKDQITSLRRHNA